MIPSMNTYMTTEEAAAEVGVSRQRFYIIAKRHGVKPSGEMSERGKQGRRVVWLSEQIVEMAQKHRQRLERLAKLQAEISEV